jgi:Fic family protein
MNTFCACCAYVNNCPYNHNLKICPYYDGRKIEKIKRRKRINVHRKSGFGFWGKKENTDRLLELREEGHTQKEIAEIIGVTRANVNARVNQLLKSGKIKKIGTGNNYRGKNVH